MRRIANSTCVFCGKSIRDAEDGSFCDECGHPAHHRCVVGKALDRDRRQCSVCGVDLTSAVAGIPNAGLIPGNVEISLPVARSPAKVFFGILFLVLCGFCLIPVRSLLAAETNVSAMVGTILPSLICAIIGLFLLQKPKVKR
jgi:hypothetical protein